MLAKVESRPLGMLIEGQEEDTIRLIGLMDIQVVHLQDIETEEVHFTEDRKLLHNFVKDVFQEVPCNIGLEAQNLRKIEDIPKVHKRLLTHIERAQQLLRNLWVEMNRLLHLQEHNLLSPDVHRQDQMIQTKQTTIFAAILFSQPQIPKITKVLGPQNRVVPDLPL